MRYHRQGFALLEVILAVILMMVAAAASYTLVKSFRSNSSTQQFIRYATSITQSAMPFVNSGVTSSITTILDNSNHTLSHSFLTSIGISQEDQLNSGGDVCTTSCYVASGMYLKDASQTKMNFSFYQDTSHLLSNYFMISVPATGVQVNQVLQNASALFSIYCPAGASQVLQGPACVLQSDDDIKNADNTYSLFLVYPKSGNTPPAVSNFSPVSS